MKTLNFEDYNIDIRVFRFIESLKLRKSNISDLIKFVIGYHMCENWTKFEYEIELTQEGLLNYLETYNVKSLERLKRKVGNNDLAEVCDNVFTVFNFLNIDYFHGVEILSDYILNNENMFYNLKVSVLKFIESNELQFENFENEAKSDFEAAIEIADKCFKK